MKTLEQILKETKGKFFRATFVKKDGSVRNMVARLGVTSHLKGGERKYNEAQYIGVFDVQARGYRLINKETLKEVKFNGNVYSV
jgi:hypothetical protein